MLIPLVDFEVANLRDSIVANEILYLMGSLLKGHTDVPLVDEEDLSLVNIQWLAGAIVELFNG